MSQSERRIVDNISPSFHSCAANRSVKRKRRPPPFSVRFSDEERAAMKTKADGQPLGAYIRAKALDDVPIKQRKSKRPSVDQKQLGFVLAALGQSRLANNINQLAKAANMGTLDVSTETDQSLQTACAEIIALRQMLIEALGVKAED